ncbi:hypothetical protein A4G19_12455 [Pasteurellaceae bacterium Macca]|nr:hypothetical protein [Pasteurellaceae bacterium Macca]MCK3656522.1 hypothetical protein [Pasteurellaceae bacterium Macca]
MPITLEQRGNGLEALLQQLQQLKAQAVYVGVPDSANPTVEGTSLNLATLAAILELGNERIPSRPFLRQTLADNQQKYVEFFAEQYQSGVEIPLIYQRLALMVQGDVQENIANGDWTANAPSTIKRKKSSRPLIDTGHLRQSIIGVVR